MPQRKKSKLKKRSKAGLCPWRVNRELFKEAHELALSLYSAGDNYVLACAEVITRAKDGSSRRVIDMMQKALDYQQKVRELFAFLDPEHYSREATDK